MSGEPRPLILIVDDDPGAATLQRRRLERADFRVEAAADVGAAMSILAGMTVDLVVMDYRLGGTTGLDLHRQMKAAGLDVPVIMVTGATDDATVIEAMRAGIRDFVVKGTDYLDYLPDAARAILKQTVAAPERLPDEHRRTSVLIVEDDSGTAILEKRQLQRAGYDVAIATSAGEALELVRKGGVNLAVLDLRLQGGTSGLDLYERMQAEGWNIPAILVTGFPDESVAIRALRIGIRDFVPKSSEYLDYLPGAVDRVVAQSRVERKLVDSELRLASIIGTTMDAIVMCDEQQTIVLFNRSAENMFGCTAAQALGTRLDTLMPTLRLQPAGPASASEARVQRRFELDAVRCNGETVPIEVSVSDVVVYDRRLFTVIARDISERRRIEGELRESSRRKDEFLGMLAHELRNPLAAIMNASEVLDMTIKEPRASKLTAVVKRQTRALSRMVDDLLDVSRVTLGKIRLTKEPLLLSQFVSRAAEHMRTAIARSGQEFDLRIENDPDSDPVWVEGDATRLEQVLANLLNNAAKFTPRGGRITMSAAREESDAVIRVRDTGVGIEESLLPKVFDLFVQADTSLDRAQGGLGIGLALVRQVIALHGGQVTAHSDGPGAGSEFVVRLPALPEERTTDGAAPVIASDETARLRVLVVDDQPDMADCVAMLIETFGHQARAVYDGATALAVVRSERPDVIFIDIGMPGVTGYDVARQIRSRTELADIRLVAVTGYGRDEDRRRAMEAGFDLHLTKPVADSTVRSVLADLGPTRARSGR
jgi:PAS domain S-box-containing protein